MTGKRVPIKNIGGHGPGDGTHYPFGLEPEVTEYGWAAPSLAGLPVWCAAKGQKRVFLWMPNGNEGSPIHPDMWARGRAAGVKVCNIYMLDNFVGNLNEDGDCEPVLYLPPLPRADGLSLPEWLQVCERQALGPVYYLAKGGHRFSACFDTLGGSAKPTDPGRHYLRALVDSLLRMGIGVGIEPPGEHGTLWHEFPTLFGWMSSWYMLESEKKQGGFMDHRWTPARGRDIYINITPEHEQHAARWLAAGYHILTPVHVDHWNAMPAQEVPQ